ncbi:MAG: hypothetical protein ACYDCM_08770 [Candidatus Acidiferrales bacterium]
MKKSIALRLNVSLARKLWGHLPGVAFQGLKELTRKHSFSVAAGDLQLLEGRWYVTHTGLLRLSSRRKCSGIRTAPVNRLSDSATNRWVFRAVVYTAGSKGFVGYGDADPSNVSPLVHGAEMRVAETRAVNRALRKAYGIGLCSVEELGSFSSPVEPARSKQNGSHSTNGNGSSNGQPRLRDRLCLLIRQHQLDSNLVKRYAAEFCGTEELRAASRDMVEAFIDHIGKCAIEDRDGLVAKLNGFSDPQEVHQ